MNTTFPSAEQVFEKVGKGLFRELTAEEELVFYREVVNKVKAMIYINQIGDVDDFTTAKNVWVNKNGSDLMGYSVEKAYDMGHKFFREVTHPDDLTAGALAIDYHKLKKGDTYGGVIRQVTSDKKVIWCHGNCIVLNEKNGNPWQFLNVQVNIQDETETQLQLLELQKQNMLLKNKAKLLSLTKREKEILCMIIMGKSDKEIAGNLNLSVETTRTHRRNILKKTGKKKSTDLAVYAYEYR